MGGDQCAGCTAGVEQAVREMTKGDLRVAFFIPMKCIRPNAAQIDRAMESADALGAYVGCVVAGASLSVAA